MAARSPTKLRLTVTQRAILGLLRENNGVGMIHSGSRVLRMGRDKRSAQCNEITIHFLVEYGLMRPRHDAQRRRTGAYDITAEGRMAQETGWHDPSQTRRNQQALVA